MRFPDWSQLGAAWLSSGKKTGEDPGTPLVLEFPGQARDQRCSLWTEIIDEGVDQRLQLVHFQRVPAQAQFAIDDGQLAGRGQCGLAM